MHLAPDRICIWVDAVREQICADALQQVGSDMFDLPYLSNFMFVQEAHKSLNIFV